MGGVRTAGGGTPTGSRPVPVHSRRMAAARPTRQDLGRYLRLAKQGDPRAFERLVVHFQALVDQVSRARMDDKEIARECAQEALLDAWRGIGSVTGDLGAFRGWLVQVVVNACKVRERYERQREALIARGGAGERQMQTLEDEGPTPDLLAEEADLIAQLTEAILLLPEPYRVVLVLHKAEFCYREIGAMLDLDVPTVGSRLHRARKHLRVALTGAWAAGSGVGSQGRADETDRTTAGLPTDSPVIGDNTEEGDR